MSNIFDMFNLDAYHRETTKALKRIFSGVIKESFLGEMVKMLQDDPKFALVHASVNNYSDMMNIDSVVTGRSFTFFSVSKMIVMSHYMNVVCLSDLEKGKLQDSNEYKKELEKEVLNMVKLEKIATFDYNKTSLEAYLPIIYYVSALANHFGNIHDELYAKGINVKEPYNSAFNYKIIYKLILKIKTCIHLADMRATDELVVVFRTLIETFMKFAALWDQPNKTINSLDELDQMAFEYNYGQPIPEDIQKEAKKFGTDRIKFINYGWIKDLKEYGDFHNQKIQLSLSGLSKILDKKYEWYQPGFGSELHKSYSACNPQTHGTLIFMNYFQLELYIFQNISVMLEFMNEIMFGHLFDSNQMFGDIDLIDELKRELDKSSKVYSFLQTDQNVLDRTTKQYIDRAKCCINMRR